MSLSAAIKTEDFKKEKHVPVIEAPASVAANTLFDVQVTIGKEIAHPNTTEHFIANVVLYYKPASGAIIQIGKADFTSHGESAAGANQAAFTEPQTTFKLKITQSGTLTALSYCNIHGLWESSVQIDVK
ncbi:MAG: class II SORL domain-containing protein [Deferribacteraceae bacterium]|jgi:superoxide reductase|nr:class II SORL domain-containing protein [Deferribacteraceae bacterium]